MSTRQTTTAASVLTGWPAPGSRASLRYLALDLDTAVRSATDTDIALALPSLPRGAAALPRRGAEMLLQWGDQTGIHQRDVVLTSQSGLMLHLEAVGEAETQQRRRFFRAPVRIDMTLHDGPRAISGRTVDLSEGGARIVCTDRPPPPPAEVMAHLQIEGDTFTFPGRVVRAEPGHQGPEAGLAFTDLPERLADVIRREVYTAQLRARSATARWSRR